MNKSRHRKKKTVIFRRCVSVAACICIVAMDSFGIEHMRNLRENAPLEENFKNSNDKGDIPPVPENSQSNDGLLPAADKSVPVKDELNEYYNANKDVYFTDQADTVYSDTTIGFIDACEKYEEEFFEEKLLVLVLLEEGSGSIRHEVKSVKTYGDKAEIDIDVTAPEQCTADMAEWHIIIDLDKDSGIYNNDNITVKLSKM